MKRILVARVKGLNENIQVSQYHPLFDPKKRFTVYRGFDKVYETVASNITGKEWLELEFERMKKSGCDVEIRDKKLFRYVEDNFLGEE